MPIHTMHPNRLRSHDAVIRVYDEAGNVIETHEHNGEFKMWQEVLNLSRISPNTRSLQPVFEQKVRRLASRLKQQKET
jgi:hypothetical protein